MAGNTHSYGYIKNGKVYRNAFLDFPEREIGELREDEETTLKYFEDRFDLAVKKVEDLEQAIEASDNKGSYLMKLIHLRDYLANFDALGDFVPLFEKLDKQEVYLRELIASNRAKNLEIKRALLMEAHGLKESTDWQQATEAFKELKMKWIKTGSVGDEHQEVEEEFKETMDTFFGRKKAFFADRKKMLDSKAKPYRQIIDEVRGLARQEDMQAAAQRVKELQKEWKTLPDIPHKMRKSLWEELKKYTDQIFGKLKTQGHKQRLRSPEESLSAKKELLEKVQELGDRHDQEAADEVKKMQGEWKRAGRISREDAKLLNEKFFKACDMILEKYFLEKIARSKFKGFSDKEEKEQCRLKLNLLRDLLGRDEKELLAFQENLEKLNSSNNANAFNKMLANKLGMQTRKVVVKKQIMKELKEKLKG